EGNTYADTPEALQEVARNATLFRPLPIQSVSLQPIWFWLVLLAGVCLVGDVATRRIAVDVRKLVTQGQEVWARLRGLRTATVATPQFLDRLTSRKSQVGEELGKAARRFEGGDMPVQPPPSAAEAPAGQERPYQPRRPAGQPKLSPEQEQEA